MKTEKSMPNFTKSGGYREKDFFFCMADDIVIGYRADDSCFPVRSGFCGGMIPLRKLSETTQPGKLGKQGQWAIKKTPPPALPLRHCWGGGLVYLSFNSIYFR